MGVQRFLPGVSQTPVAPAPTKYFTTHALKERGWTATMIATLLPHHDAARTSYVRLPGNALVKLYLRTRVEEVELSEEFLIEQERVTKAKARRGPPRARRSTRRCSSSACSASGRATCGPSAGASAQTGN